MTCADSIAAQPVLCYIDKVKEKSKKWIIGIDEVGRGPLAGPVYVCAVAIEQTDYKKSRWVGLTDSKKLSAKVREKWHARALELEQNGIIRIGIASRTALQIDTKGITQCIRDCIRDILGQLAIKPSNVLVLLDGGLKAPEEYVFQKTIIKGDQKHRIISLASVVAKVVRDRYMDTQSKKYAQYNWQTNKGYGTKEHVAGLVKHGTTPLHRKSYLSKIMR